MSDIDYSLLKRAPCGAVILTTDFVAQFDSCCQGYRAFYKLTRANAGGSKYRGLVLDKKGIAAFATLSRFDLYWFAEVLGRPVAGRGWRAPPSDSFLFNALFAYAEKVGPEQRSSIMAAGIAAYLDEMEKP